LDSDSAAAAGVSYPYYGFSNYAGVALQPYPHVRLKPMDLSIS